MNLLKISKPFFFCHREGLVENSAAFSVIQCKCLLVCDKSTSRWKQVCHFHHLLVVDCFNSHFVTCLHFYNPISILKCFVIPLLYLGAIVQSYCFIL